MKLAILGGALALSTIAGCAAITERTGLSTETQVCLATEAAEIVQDQAAADLPMQDMIVAVAAACDVDLTKLITDTIQTAILAADKAE